MSRAILLTAICVMAFALAGCNDERTVCDAAEEDCACAVDEDCVLTAYHVDVAGADECYEPAWCCYQYGEPRNTDAAERNQVHFDEVGCELPGGECDDCPLIPAYARCEQNRCVGYVETRTNDRVRH